ncbi:hypothetical protein D3C86_1945560 [compost metagenome]
MQANQEHDGGQRLVELDVLGREQATEHRADRHGDDQIEALHASQRALAREANCHEQAQVG